MHFGILYLRSLFVAISFEKGQDTVYFLRYKIIRIAAVLCLVLGFMSPNTVMAANSKYAALVIDADTGIVLHQQNAGKRRYPASLTKMMTVYLAFQALESGKLSMHTRLRVSRHAANQKPSKIGLRSGTTVPFSTIMDAIIIKSANDAAVVMAEAIGGNENRFAVLMNRMARRLGMLHTKYYNASGLPDIRQVTTAYDQARLAIALRRDYPQYYKLFARNSFNYAGRTYYSHNRVTKHYRGADGLKTGYIRASGFNLVTSARRGDKSVVGVVFGGRSTKSRDANMMKLLDRAFYKMSRNKYSRAGSKRIKPKSLYAKQIPVPVMKNTEVAAVGMNRIDTDAMNELVSEVMASQGGFSQEVRTIEVSDSSDVPEPKLKRDIFSPSFQRVSYTRVTRDALGFNDDIKALRVRVGGSRVPLPRFKPVPQESGLVHTNASVADSLYSYADFSIYPLV